MKNNGIRWLFKEAVEQVRYPGVRGGLKTPWTRTGRRNMARSSES